MGGAGEEAKKKTFARRSYSMIALAKRPDMLEFYTGFNLETIEAADQNLGGGRAAHFAFFFFSFPRAHGA